MSDNSYIDTSYSTSIDTLCGDALRERIAQAVNDVREQTPLAQSFTNFVTINLVANATVSSLLSPRQYTAISHAATW